MLPTLTPSCHPSCRPSSCRPWPRRPSAPGTRRAALLRIFGWGVEEGRRVSGGGARRGQVSPCLCCSHSLPRSLVRCARGQKRAPPSPRSLDRARRIAPCRGRRGFERKGWGRVRAREGAAAGGRSRHNRLEGGEALVRTPRATRARSLFEAPRRRSRATAGRQAVVTHPVRCWRVRRGEPWWFLAEGSEWCCLSLSRL